MIKHFLGSIILAFLSISTVTGQSNALDLSGKWNFQIDREDTGVKEQWFRKILEDHINLPGSMPEKLKGDEVTVHTQWTGSLYGEIQNGRASKTTILPDSGQTLCRCGLVSEKRNHTIRLER